MWGGGEVPQQASPVTAGWSLLRPRLAGSRATSVRAMLPPSTSSLGVQRPFSLKPFRVHSDERAHRQVVGGDACESRRVSAHF